MKKHNIVVKTIKMFPPAQLNGKQVERKSVSLINQQFIEHETFLRKQAYRNTDIKIDDSFFDDSDMLSGYNLVVVFEEQSGTPLLSSRYYFNKAVIQKYLNGDNNATNELILRDKTFNVLDYKDNELFLADRLSGNLDNPIYQEERNLIFSLFYQEIVTQNKNCTLLLMVRNEKHLARYLAMGFEIIGNVTHKTKKHWVIIIDIKNDE